MLLCKAGEILVIAIIQPRFLPCSRASCIHRGIAFHFGGGLITPLKSHVTVASRKGGGVQA